MFFQGQPDLFLAGWMDRWMAPKPRKKDTLIFRDGIFLSVLISFILKQKSRNAADSVPFCSGIVDKKNSTLGSCGGSVGRAVAADTRDLSFKSQHWQNFIYQLYSIIEKTKLKKKRLGMAHLRKIATETFSAWLAFANTEYTNEP